MRTYFIGEVAKELNLSISTLRYYDKEGLLEDVERTAGNIRLFKEEDIQQLRMLECLKGTGMKLKDIKVFFEWCKQGNSTIEQRYHMLLERKAEVKRQIEDLNRTLEVIDHNCEYYISCLPQYEPNL